MSSEWALKKDIIEIGRRMWQRQFVAANDGNISVRLNGKELLATATGVSKGFLSGEMIVRTDLEGNPVSSSGYRPSSELKMHLEIYKQRPDINAVVHAHPVYCTTFAVAGIELDKCVLPEAMLSLGAVPTAPFGLPSTDEVPESIRPYIKKSDAVLLQNHGALTLGKDLFDAYYRMETLEHYAHIVWNAIQLGSLNVLSENERDRILDLKEKYGLQNNLTVPGEQPIKITDEVIRSITKKVIDRLK